MMRHRALLIAAAAFSFASPSASAQTVLVRVTTGEMSEPIFGALAYLVDDAGQTAKNALTDERGRALFLGIQAGTYRVRIEMIGMATAETEVFAIDVGTTVTKEVRMESSAIQLEGIEIQADGGRCRVRPGEAGLLVADVWDEARKALSAAAFTEEQGTYRYRTMLYDRQLDRETKIVLSEEQSEREGYMLTPFESLPAEELVENGFVQADGSEQLYYAPDANVLLSDAFLDTHCFRLTRGSGGAQGLVGLGFEPTGENRRVADIAGTLWIDLESSELRWLEYTYQYLDIESTSNDVGGRVDFQRMPNGTWIVPEWWIRMPLLTLRTDTQGRASYYISRYQQRGGQVLEAREAGGRSLGQRVETGGVEGIVVDSLGAPLRLVRVGVVGSAQEVYTNLEGGYSITGLREGRYQVRFIDPMLEDIGFIPEPVSRDVVRGEVTYLEFHMPSVGDVLFDACRDVPREEGPAIIAGVVRNEFDRLVPNAIVRVTWTDVNAVSIRRNSGVGEEFRLLGEEMTGIETTTDSGGFYRFCGVPEDQPLRVVALLGDAESETYQLQLAEFEAGLQVILIPGGGR